jgi:small nuclear ribonucleoprotein (snRNP)-like protein
MSKERFVDDTWSLNKALFHASSCKQYLELIKIDTKGATRETMNGLLSRVSFVINFVLHKVSEEDRENLKKELEDSISTDAILGELVKLSVSQRNLIETLITAMIKGENVEFAKPQTA